ncbi:MAG: YceH family protein [Betaproteobacteria bacterium]
MTAATLPLLSPLETRVLGVLVEKQLTTPDYYPLSLNALVAGCNQKSSRDPVMSVGEDEAQGALDALKERKLVTNTWGASRRVVRYSHNFPQVFDTDPGTTALLATLMLRGAQTPGELRIACERMYRFADLSSVEAYLEEMAGRPAHALVVKLPKQPGAREHRWAQLLGGPAGAATVVPAMDAGAATARAGGAGLEAEFARLRDEVAELRTMVERLREEIKK